jgi:ankyrin repeat protein
MVGILLTIGKFDPNLAMRDGTTALHIAAGDNSLEMMDLLLVAGAYADSTDEDGSTPVFFACRKGHRSAMDKLKQANANMDARRADGETLLHACVDWDGDLVPFVCELRKGLPDAVNAVDRHRNTALFKAASTNRASAAKHLVDEGAAVNKSCAHGRTALHEAARCNNVSVLSLLISIEADLNARDRDGRTPLMVACVAGSVEAAATLTAAGASLALTDAEEGSTALHLACKYGRGTVVCQLLRDGASSAATDAAGLTPVQVAHSNLYDYIMSLFNAAEPISWM